MYAPPTAKPATAPAPDVAAAAPVAAPALVANRTGLPDRLRYGIETLSGVGLDDVRVHRDSPRPRAIGALAYAHGPHIHLAPGQDRHLPHEAWHVVQQKQARVRPTLQMKDGTALNDDTALEREADAMGARALAIAPADHVPPIAVATAGAVVQRVIDPDLVAARPKRDRRTNAVQQHIDAYHATLANGTHQEKLDAVHALTRSTLGYLDDHNSEDLTEHPGSTWGRNVLNAVQVDHRALVKTSIKRRHATPPVAGFGALSAPEQAQVRGTWNHLVRGTGNIAIDADETMNDGTPRTGGHPGFRTTALAHFARLMETPSGRDLVTGLATPDGGAKPVTIKPGLAMTDTSASEFAASPTDQTGTDRLRQVDPDAMFGNNANPARRRAKYKRGFTDLTLDPAASPEDRAAAIYAHRAANPGKKGFRLGGQHYLYGAGSGADVRITSDIRDAEDHPTSRFVNRDRNEIVIPNFMTLGHELGHVAHMRAGVLLADHSASKPLLDQVGVPAGEQGAWSDMEEFGTISGVENRLRAEYGMRPRFGHGNQASTQRQHLTGALDAMYDLSKLQPPAHRAATDTPWKEANTHYGNLRAADTRTALRRAGRALTGQLDTAMPHLPADQAKAVRGHMARYDRHLARTGRIHAAAAADAAQSALAILKAHPAPKPPPAPPPPQPGFFERMWAKLPYT